jgi:hypothetical protein
MDLNLVSANDWIYLRRTVILLGEANNWWPSKVLTEHGEEFLAYVLPKTKSAAALQLALEISRAEHDRQVGPGRYHLFRLPQKWEELIFRQLSSAVENDTIPPMAETMNKLKELSSEISITSAQGPILIGASTELNDWSVFQSFARHYYEAFKKGYKAYPYLN